MTDSEDWLFREPRNVAVFTTADVMSGAKPILYVAHDVEDGAWQFMPGETFKMDEAKILAFHEIVEMDSSIKELANLPEGWAAERRSKTDTWRRFKQPE